MARDLGTGEAQVHEKARAVHAFWFALTSEQQFAKDDSLDREIAARFGAWRDAVFGGGGAGWRDDPATLLAAIILLDQFSRNINRGSKRAFEADDLAVSLTRHAIDRGWDTRYTDAERVFLYMPLMHAEDRALQQLSLDRFTALGNERNLGFARDHASVIERFGRFPSRNAALGRVSTPAEDEYLSRPDAGW